MHQLTFSISKIKSLISGFKILSLHLTKAYAKISNNSENNVTQRYTEYLVGVPHSRFNPTI